MHDVPGSPVATAVRGGIETTLVANHVFPPARLWSRNLLLPLVRAETGFIHRLQKRVRTPTLDVFFTWISALGTHLFFMIALPLLFWVGESKFARHLTIVLAQGVYISGALKDFFCLPRPLSPPVSRLSVSSGALFEYGFPSTHSVNGVCMAFFCYLYYSNDSILACLAASIYACALCFSRVYCGMHTCTDVAGGVLLGIFLLWLHYGYLEEFDHFLTTSWSVPFVTAFYGLSITAYPDPVDPCPCFDDSVAFVGVVIGVVMGTWHYAGNALAAPEPAPAATVPYSWERLGLLGTLARFVVGVLVIFLWRLAVKKLCYIILPPIFYAFELPYRNFYQPARDYKSIRSTHIKASPSLIHLPDLMKSEAVGAISDTDVKEQLAAAAAATTSKSMPERKVFSKERNEANKRANDLRMRLYRLKKYDVDIVTKLIVYSGIGVLAVEGIPILFHFLGL